MTDVPVSLCCREDSTTRSKCSSTAGRDPLCNKTLLTVSFVPGPFPVPAQSPAAVEEILDRENKRMADSLASKVTRLKSLALDIDRDAEDQNRYLDSMNQVARFRVDKEDKPVTYEEVHGPHYIAHRKGRLSLHTGEGPWCGAPCS
uniref:Bet1 golgi vesicular membrane trafficking protein like n=1 Tax=Ursus maritimus TaxID=29073 RepID=A0A452TF40_URSMA